MSNGLLIPDISHEDMKVLADLDITISISAYSPTVEIKEKIVEKLRIYGVKYLFTDPITKFRKRIDMTASNDEKLNFEDCLFKEYSFLYHGKFSICSSPILIGKFNKRFKQSIDVSDDVINIYASHIDKQYMEKYLRTPKKCCRYCGKPEEFDWSNQRETKMEDWLIEKQSITCGS